MYSNTTLLSICECFDTNTNNNSTKYLTNNCKIDETLSLLKYIPSPKFIPPPTISICNNQKKNTIITMETRRLYPNKTRTVDINCNQYNNATVKKQSTEARIKETLTLRCKFPTKVPIMVQRYRKEKSLPTLDKSKFLVPQEITLSQFYTIIRHRMSVRPTETLYLLVNEKTMLNLSCTLAEAYQEYKSKDGFLYITYASQTVFG